MDTALISELTRIRTATLGQFLSEGFMAPAIQSIGPARRICGPALTVRLPGIDGGALSGALCSVRPGEVLVIDRCGDLRHACFGIVAAEAALRQGVAGVVIDGFVTDYAALLGLGLPLWCRGRSPLSTRDRQLAGGFGTTITCGGSMVSRGDLILADDSGVVVLDPAGAADTLARARALQQAEAEALHRLHSGAPLNEVLSPHVAADGPRRPAPFASPQISRG